MRTRGENYNVHDEDYLRFVINPVIKLLYSGLVSFIKKEDFLPENPVTFL